jgi:hypothetical protein
MIATDTSVSDPQADGVVREMWKDRQLSSGGCIARFGCFGVIAEIAHSHHL